MEEPKPDWDQRWDEVRHLKALLARAEDRPFWEPWAFWVWSGLVALGTVFNAWAETQWQWSLHQSFLMLWLPLVVAGGLAETGALIVRMGRTQQPWLSRPFLKILGGLFGFWVGGTTFILAALHPANPVPALILLFLSMSFFWIGSVSFAGHFLEALFLLAAAIVLLIGGWHGAAAYWTAGVVSSAAFFVGGFHGRGRFLGIGVKRDNRV